MKVFDMGKNVKFREGNPQHLLAVCPAGQNQLDLSSIGYVEINVKDLGAVRLPVVVWSVASKENE